MADVPPPGTNSDSPAYWTNKTLTGLGWTPQAIDWLIRNVPVKFQSGPLSGQNQDVMGDYTTSRAPFPMIPESGTIGGIRTRIDPGVSDSRLGPLFQHEAQHAWDITRGQKLPMKDLSSLMSQLGLDDQFRTWMANYQKNTGSQLDQPHYTHAVNQGMGIDPSSLPDWFKSQYFSEYR